ncbi:MAG: MAC/perforin domain-containing protein [Pseudomonadota bacterium]
MVSKRGGLGGLMIGAALCAPITVGALAQNSVPGSMPRLQPGQLLQGSEPRKGRPIEAFKGCKVPSRLQAGAANNADRMRSRDASAQDATAARVFASFDIPEGTATEADLAEDCRYRLDGIWVQDSPLALDESKAANDLFEGLKGQRLNARLTHSNFTTPDLMYVSMATDGSSIAIRRATQGRQPIVLYAIDNVPMRDVMQPSGASKTYRYRGGTRRGRDVTLTVSVSRTGKPELRWDGYSYNRPQPTVSRAQDIDVTDVFLIGNNLDNYRASLRGYNVITQDPFELNRNPLADIFATADPRDFAIVEKRTVPLGLKYIPDGVQGSVTSKEMISRQFDFQRTAASSFGFNIGFTKKDKETGETKGSLGAGADFAKSSTLGRQFGMKRALSMGFARHKLYTLVLDRPFAKLSDDFIDAVDFAYRKGRYDGLIDKFGTHYPYAVTYGSQARMWASFDRETMQKWQSDSQNFNVKAGLAIGGFEIGASGSRFTEEARNSEELEESSEAGFDAVGGTGSFDQSGFSTGTPVPILADLRPISDLLNPLYFPNEPEVWGQVRARLEAAIERRLELAALNGGFGSVIPQRAPKGLVTNISVITHRAKKENVRVAFGRALYKPGFVRVCLRNRLGGSRHMTVSVRGVNTMKTYGANKPESCATISSTETLQLGFQASGIPSKVFGVTSIKLDRFDNGYLDFLYGVGP